MRWVCWQRSRTYRRSWSTCVCSVMTPTPCPQPANRSSWMWRDSIAVVCGTSHKYVSIYVIHPTFIKQVSFIIHSFPCIISSLNGTFLYTCIFKNNLFSEPSKDVENLTSHQRYPELFCFCFQHSPPSSPSSIGSRKSSMCSINSITSSSSGSIKSHSPSHLNHLRNSAQVSAALSHHRLPSVVMTRVTAYQCFTIETSVACGNVGQSSCIKSYNFLKFLIDNDWTNILKQEWIRFCFKLLRFTLWRFKSVYH